MKASNVHLNKNHMPVATVETQPPKQTPSNIQLCTSPGSNLLTVFQKDPYDILSLVRESEHSPVMYNTAGFEKHCFKCSSHSEGKSLASHNSERSVVFRQFRQVDIHGLSHTDHSSVLRGNSTEPKEKSNHALFTKKSVKSGTTRARAKHLAG